MEVRHSTTIDRKRTMKPEKESNAQVDSDGVNTRRVIRHRKTVRRGPPRWNIVKEFKRRDFGTIVADAATERRLRAHMPSTTRRGNDNSVLQ